MVGEGSTDAFVTTVRVMCDHCSRWGAVVEIPLDSRLVDEPDESDGETATTCPACGDGFAVYYAR